MTTRVLTSEQQRELMATVWPADSWSRRACSAIWLAQVQLSLKWHVKNKEKDTPLNLSFSLP